MSWRLWLLIILLVVAIITIINPTYFTGKVIIKEVTLNSSAAEAGVVGGEIVKQLNGQAVESLEDYASIISDLDVRAVEFEVVTEDETFTYKSKGLDLQIAGDMIIAVYGKAQEAGLETSMIVEEINGMSLDDYPIEEIKLEIEPTTRVTLLTDSKEYVFLSGPDLGITVAGVPKTRIRTGLDLQGGARALVRPEKQLSSQEMASLLEVVRYRLNVYGLTDVNVREASDLQGNSYMLVELAGATPQELQELVGKQGKFEAKIGNKTVFAGGQKDITFVCRNDATCSYIEQCSAFENGEICRFHFEIHLSEEAAKKHAEITRGLEENITDQGQYLNETLDLYLDDQFVDQLLIDVNLKGQETTRIAISGSGSGATRAEAYEATQDNMKKLQTVLITGSLPFKLEIVKLDSISPALGREFTRNIFVAAIVVFIAVCLIIFIRYRKVKLFIPIIITMFSELLLVLAIAAAIRWNLDLAGIAGIIAAIGTGVDDQIVMIEEASISKQFSIRERIKRAFFIILGAYATTAIALLPLGWAGAGLLRGFAVTTFLGITIGVFITRPAFAEILRRITKD